ncbi:MAG: M23 family metallopeptidase [Rhodocyclaceae bacterium]|nr:M23 family metallopeptidase [Rhodocyclaceae bacterium]
MTKAPILNHAPLPSGSDARFRRVQIALLAVFSLLGMATALGTVRDATLYEGMLTESLMAVSLPSPTWVPAADALADIGRETRVVRGDTVAQIFRRLDIDDEAALNALRLNREAALLFRQLAPGKTIAARVSPQGELKALIFPLNGEKDAVLTILRTAEGLEARVTEMAVEKTLVVKSARIDHSLFAAADAVDIPDAVAMQLADIFGGEIDFHRDLRKGDRFSLLYEVVIHQGRPLRSGRILAAEFVNAGKTHSAFWFETPEGGGYYDAQGVSLKKAFLRSPLEFSRITSGFSLARYHPILKEVRAHRGIDYAAPVGARVRATGDGVVEFVGVQGGYGKVVILRHAGNRHTVYGHLSGFAKGLHKGQRVSQGELIGYVGATGLATGPHLHYEFRVDGVHRNPLTAALPSAPPLSRQHLAAFAAAIEKPRALLASVEPVRTAWLID